MTYSHSFLFPRHDQGNQGHQIDRQRGKSQDVEDGIKVGWNASESGVKLETRVNLNVGKQTDCQPKTDMSDISNWAEEGMKSEQSSVRKQPHTA
jgi:hypothetical protein